MSYIPEDIEVRRNALALFNALKEAEEASEAIEDQDLPSEGEDEATVARESCYAARQAVEAKLDADLLAINKKYLGDTSKQALESAADVARNAYNDAAGEALREDDEGNAVICAASGTPIYDTDEVVEDHETGEMFLRAAIGLPPRPVEEEEIEEAA